MRGRAARRLRAAVDGRARRRVVGHTTHSEQRFPDGCDNGLWLTAVRPGGALQGTVRGGENLASC